MRIWDIINNIHSDKNENYYYWLNENQGTYFGAIYDVKNFGFGEDYVFYDNGKHKWCENLDISNCEVSKSEEDEIVLTDGDGNSLIIGLKDANAEQYLD